MNVRIVMTILLGTLFLEVCFASAKEDYVVKVMKECKLSREDALKTVTPGRSGTVVKVKLCPQNPVKVSETCNVSCSRSSGNVVGER